jgi:hypothetical protein
MRLRELRPGRTQASLVLAPATHGEVTPRAKRSALRWLAGVLLLAALSAASGVPAADDQYAAGPASESTPDVGDGAVARLAEALELLQEQPETAIALLQPLWDDAESPVRSAAGMGLLRAHHALGQHRQVLEISEVLLGLPALDHEARSQASRLRFFAATRLGDSAAMAAPAAEMEFRQPDPHSPSRPLEESVLDNPYVYGGLIVLALLLSLRILVSLVTGLVSLGLYMDRVEGDANVEGEYRRFGLFRRVRYTIWTPGGMLTGSAPAWCARKGLVTIAWRPLQPRWHRPRALMLEDVMLAASLFLAWPFVVVMRVVAALRVGREA